MLLCRKPAFQFLFALSGLVASAAAQGGGTITSMSMANYGSIVAPDSIAAGFGSNFALTPVTGSLPLQTTLGNTQVAITDSSGALLSSQLYMISPTQINFLVPANAALGKATVTVTSPTGTFKGTLLISNVAPGIVTANMMGTGVPAAMVLRITAAGVVTYETPFQSGTTAGTYVTSPINLSTATDNVYLVLYGTGIRRHSLNPVEATIGGVKVPVQYAGAQSQFPGLDQINIGPLPPTLVGTGQVTLVLTVDGVPANKVSVAFQ